MATTTPNFGWAVPTSTDLVKDGAVAIETLGDSIDASLVDLKGGTTGQVLAKATNTDMDFSWTTPTDQTPLTTKGDLFTFTTVDARLGVGTNGQVLQADSTAATGLKWATATATSGPAFSATKTGTQTITAATWTKVAFNVETFDTNSCYDPTTNYRFTPTTAGIYSMNTTIEMSSGGGSYFYMQFYKNGAGIQTLTKQGSFTDFLQSGSSLVSMNGTTDYLEVYAYASGTSPQIDAGACLFGGAWIRSN